MANNDDNFSWLPAFDRMWTELKDGTLACYNDQGVPSEGYLDLYCHMMSCWDDFIRLISLNGRLVGLIPRDVTHLLSVRLTALLETVATEIAKRIDLVGEDEIGLLRRYMEEWDKYRRASSKVNGLFESFNRRSWNPFVIQSTLRAWRDNVIATRQDELAHALTIYMRNRREASRINTEYMTCADAVITTFGELDLSDEKGLAIYQKILEVPFLETSRSPLSRMSAKFHEFALDDYIKQAARFLQNEQGRFQTGILPVTITKLIGICEQELIEKHADSLIGQLFAFISENKLSNVHRLFAFICQSGPTYHQLKLQIEERIFDQCLRLIDDFPRPVAALIKQYTSSTSNFFTWDLGVCKAVGKGILRAMNVDPERILNLLARHYDSVLKRLGQNVTDEDVMMLNDLFLLYKYVGDKDAFLNAHAKYAIKRPTTSSASRDVERHVLEQFKRESGVAATAKLFQLQQDVTESADLNLKFRVPMPGIEFRVFRSNAWPYSINCNSLSLLVELETVASKFTQFYKECFPLRKLTILHNHSTGQLESTCFRRRHLLKLNTYQMTLLMTFNDTDIISVGELKEKTKFASLQCFESALTSLLDSSLLTSSTPGLENDSQLSLNLSYTSRHTTVKINMPKPSSSSLVERSLGVDIAKHRRCQTQSAIVRVVKMKRQINQNDLHAEVTVQLSARFTPSSRMFKGCIETLIDGNYIRRSEQDQNIFMYVTPN